MSHIKVLLVEDDPDWVKGMTTFLHKEADILIVGAATGREEALKLARSLDFDVVLMDIHLGDEVQDGIFVAAEIHDIHPAKIIMLTSRDDEEAMTQSFTAGAINFIEKNNFKQLPHAIRNAYHHPEPMEALLKEYSRLKREEQLKELTTAEREVFELIEQGYTKSQIERTLYKTESTVKNQVNKILKKIGVRSSREAVEKVRRKGLFRGEDP